MSSRLTLAVVLAGGLATRMGGGDKPLLPLGGRTVLDHVLERVRPQAATLILNANGDPDRFGRFGIPVVSDGDHAGGGPLAGILAALDWTAARRADLPWVLTVAGDTPFLPTDLLDRLQDARTKAGAVLAAAASGGRMHPVAGLWPVAHRDKLRGAMAAGERRVGHWMREQGLAVAEWNSLPLDPFTNLNTPEDHAAAERALRASPAGASGEPGWPIPGTRDPVLDLRGLKCPLPALKTRAALRRLPPGTVLQVETTDPLAAIDVPNAAREEGAEILDVEVRGEVRVFRIVVAEKAG